MKLQGIRDKVVIEIIPEEESEQSGIAVVKVRKDTLLKGKVITVGYPVEEVMPGDIVYFSAYGYEEVDGLAITTEDMIYAKVS